MFELLFSLALALGSLIYLPAAQPVAGRPAQRATPTVVAILSPQPGQALQGNVPIVGTTSREGFQSAELVFSYQEDPTGSWFPIARFTQPVVEDELVSWDTTTLTDGNYTLRLLVFAEGEEPLVIEVPDLRVRNYTPVETSTPTPTPTPEPAGSSRVQSTPTPTLVPPSPTPLPTNPAEINPADITRRLSRGLVGVASAFVLFGLLLGLRAVARR